MSQVASSDYLKGWNDCLAACQEARGGNAQLLTAAIAALNSFAYSPDSASEPEWFRAVRVAVENERAKHSSIVDSPKIRTWQERTGNHQWREHSSKKHALAEIAELRAALSSGAAEPI